MSNRTRYAILMSAFPPAQAGGGVPVPPDDGPRRGHPDETHARDAHVPWHASPSTSPCAAQPVSAALARPHPFEVDAPLQEPRSSDPAALLTAAVSEGLSASSRRTWTRTARRLRTRRQAPRTRPPMTSTLLSTLPKAKRVGIEPAVGVIERRPVAVPDGELVEVRQQVSGGAPGGARPAAGVEPVPLPVDELGGQPRRRCRPRSRRRSGRPLGGLGEGQARPPGEVLQLRRTPAPEVPVSEPAERLLAIQDGRARHALVEQRVGELAAAAWTADDQRVQLRGDDQVGQPLPVGGDAGRAQDRRRARSG